MSLKWLGIAGAVIVAVLALTWQASGNIPTKFMGEASTFKTATPHVALKSGLGSGSGVHIGNGYIVSAAHVVGTATQMVLTDSEKRSTPATVLRVNKEYDIALLHVESMHFHYTATAPLNCAPNYVGQKVIAYGNPMGIEFLYTRGEVNGASRKHMIWKEVVPLDGTIVYGQSGGGVIDSVDGSVVGITVGLVPTPYGIAAIGFAVPARVVCHLLGRA